MLSSIYIKDFAIVHKLELSLSKGLTVLTGETGAGKSIMIDALALLLGERVDGDVIRHGCNQAEISASFELDPNQDPGQWLAEQDLFDDRECVLRRLIYSDKPTKGFINGRPVPMQMLRELGEILVDIHGQHEHQSLLKRDIQRRTLDDYAGHSDTVQKLAATYDKLSSLKSRLETLQQQSTDREARIGLLRYQVDELDALQLEEGELPKLEEEHDRLAHASELLDGVQGIAQRLSDNDDANIAQLLNQSMVTLEPLTDYDPALAEISVLLNEAHIRVDEAVAQLHQYLGRLELDPQRLQWLNDRLALMHDLARKHQVKPDTLGAVLTRQRVELGDIEDAKTSLSKLEQDIGELSRVYFNLADLVRENRQQAATSLSTQVTDSMQALGMPGGHFEVSVTALESGQCTVYGTERIEFMVSANPGQPARPLAKVASGGELSRISLALQVVTARIGRIPTLIFDEVDVGIGGRVAEIVGQQLRGLGDLRQVLCITHLAQVAAQGHAHLQVSKQSEPPVSVAIDTLDPRKRIDEIARMIGGVTITDQTLAHAEDMLSRV
ncbi:MAG TPA: DNA repair protein RecN [Acidiferrobacteraceae bacterium]|nr:DNA repair protein RecN [Acidiferrobacteraceae bacterium]